MGMRQEFKTAMIPTPIPRPEDNGTCSLACKQIGYEVSSGWFCRQGWHNDGTNTGCKPGKGCPWEPILRGSDQ